MTTVASDQKISPMMMQWYECKEKAPDAILFFRLGDFYESFYDDALLLAKEVDITLTKRQEVPMAGVPAHTADTYIDKLVSKGFRVAIAEQLEDPKTVKGIVKREIVRIVTPGSVINSSLISDKSNNFLASLHQINRTLGLSVLDLTTSDFRVFEFETSASLFDELCRLRPKELIVSEKCAEHQKENLNILKHEIDVSCVTREDWQFDLQATVNFLIRHFRVHNLDSFGLKTMSCATSAAGALLSYVQNELNVSIDHITHIQKEVISKYMALDIATQKHLELVESLHERSRHHTLLALIDETATAMGARLLSHWLLHPLKEVLEIHKRQDAVEFFLHFPLKQQMQDHLVQIRDLERLMMKIETGFAGPRDILGLGLSLQQVPLAMGMLSGHNLPDFLARHVSSVASVQEITHKILSALVEEPPVKLGDGNTFRKGYHADLDELKEIQSNSHEWMANYQTELRNHTSIKSLKVGFTKAFGYYIEVSRGQADKIPDHFERRQTLVNAERFITAELKEYEHKMLSAEDKISHLEIELMQRLKKEIASYSQKVREIASAIAHIDCVMSLSIVAKRRNFIRPVVDDSAVLHIEGGRHPSIEASLKSESFIANDVFLDDQHQKLYVITGPNMAGKSTFIRQVALLAILAQMGSFIPAKRARIGVIDKVFTRIGASDNLAKGQSTFMVEMTETAHILHNATSKSLVILDEIGRGTSTYDGISIAWAVAEFLLTTPGKAPKTLFATHYCEMIDLEDKIPGALNYNIAVHESEKGIVFLRKIIRGGTDKSYGIHVARLAGLPPPVIKRAKEVLKTLEEKSGKSSSKKDKDLNQLSLFTQLPNTEEHPILSKLRNIDPESLTPLQALQQLIDWRRELL